ncbi:MAG TPA: hypothetical protein VFA09_07235 [Ktedonobacteraceae bacterium]|nr:hypothetical protein [Ktedonobacteraceae bacterium]HZU67057.1 hypothetical protein [Ktedonobacteraceae bacterium]
MWSALRWRFWLETVLASVASILFVITLVWRNWIEIVFKVDPDNANGSLEWFVVATFLVVAIALFVSAGYEVRRARAALS